MWQSLWDFLDRWFFGPVSIGRNPLAVTVRVLRYPYAVVRDMWSGEINLRAMGLVFTTLLALVPLLAFAFAILKAFGAHGDLEPIVYEFFRPVGDQATALTAQVMQLVDSVSSAVVGSVGLALLLWTLLSTIAKVEDSFNFLWRVEQPRSFGRRAAEYLSLLIMGPILLVAFLGLSHAALSSEPLQHLAELPWWQRLRAGAVNVAPYAMVTAFFTAMYMFVPNTRVKLRAALIGALVGGVVWAAVGKMFTAFVIYSTRLTLVYAGFAVIVAAVLWTWLGWLILLAGAQLSFYVQNPSYLRLGLRRMRLSGAEHEQLALKVMYLVARAHVAGAQRWTVDALAAELGLPGIALGEVARELERAGLLILTDGGEYVPGRDIGRISVHEILDVVRTRRAGHLALRQTPIPVIERLAERLDEAWRQCCSNQTLRDLVEDASLPMGPGAAESQPRAYPRPVVRG